MSLHDYLRDVKLSKVNENEEPQQTDKRDDSYYYNMLNEDTGLRYDIPMLSTMDASYYWKYISYMKQKEQNEETFNKMLNWE